LKKNFDNDKTNIQDLGRVLINAQIAAFNGTFASVSKKTFAHTLTDEVTQAHDASWPVLILKCPTKSPLP
jgi:hypothetical protein